MARADPIDVYELHVARDWRRGGACGGQKLGSLLMHEMLCAGRTMRASAILLTRWKGVASRFSVSPTNKDFYSYHKFRATDLAPRRAMYEIWKRALV